MQGTKSIKYILTLMNGNVFHGNKRYQIGRLLKLAIIYAVIVL